MEFTSVNDVDIHRNRPCFVQLSGDQTVVRQTDFNRRLVTGQQLRVRIAQLEDLLSQKGVQLQQERVRNGILSDSVERLQDQLSQTQTLLQRTETNRSYREAQQFHDQICQLGDLLSQSQSQMRQMIERYEEQEQKLKTENRGLMIQLGSQVPELKQKLFDEQMKVHHLKEDLKEKDKKIKQLEQELDYLKSQNQRLSRGVIPLGCTEIDSRNEQQLGSQVPELKQALSDEKMKVHHLKEDLKEKDKEIKKLEQELDCLKSQNQRLSRRVIPLGCTEIDSRNEQQFDHMNNDLDWSFKFPNTEKETSVDLHKLGRFQVSTRPFECRQCHEAFKSWADMKRSSCHYHPIPRIQVNTPGGNGKTYLWICCKQYDSTGRMIQGCRTGNHISYNASTNRDERARAGIARASS